MRSTRVQGLRRSVAEILGRPGNLSEVSLRAPLEGISNACGRLSNEPIDAELRLESVVEGILVTGSARGIAEMSCARCLKPLESRLDVDVCELYVAPGHEAPPEEESYEVDGLEVDLEPMLRDAFALSLPLRPLCGTECRGLCPGCGVNLDEGVCRCKDDDVDPRWAGLSQLRDKLG